MFDSQQSTSDSSLNAHPFFHSLSFSSLLSKPRISQIPLPLSSPHSFSFSPPTAINHHLSWPFFPTLHSLFLSSLIIFILLLVVASSLFFFLFIIHILSVSHITQNCALNSISFSSFYYMAPPSDINHLSHPCIYGDYSFSRSERRPGFMKWLSKLFKGGSNRGRGGRRLQDPGEENMVWHDPSRALDDRARAQKEKDDLGHSMALSSAEDFKRPNAHNQGYNYGADYPKALQDHLNSSAYPPYSAAPYYPPRDYRKICGGCNQDILYGNCLSCMDTYFHPDCFRCYSCHYPITEREFSLSGKHPYHKSCFKELTHPKCEVCFQFIPINDAGLIEYRCHPFWSQKYCPSHEYDNTARCCSCERLEPRNIKYYRLEDGRSLCMECMESAIIDTGDCQPLYHSIRDYYEGMNMRIDQQIPMLLVAREALNEAIVGEKNAFHHMPETRGICLSEEQTITSIHRRPRNGSHRRIGMRTQNQMLVRKCEVTAILVLYGLPRLLTGAILAHELMHAWLRLKGYRNLNPEVEEGICQVLSYMWLESEVMPSNSAASSSSSSYSSSYSYPSSSKKGSKSQVENKLGEFFKNQIANDSSPAYGGGFRAANEAVNKYGLRAILDHIRFTGLLPE